MRLGPCTLHSRYRCKTGVVRLLPSSSLNIHLFLSPFVQILSLEILVVFIYGVFINFKSETQSNPCLWYYSLFCHLNCLRQVWLTQRLHTCAHIHTTYEWQIWSCMFCQNNSITGNSMRIGGLVLLESSQKKIFFLDLSFELFMCIPFWWLLPNFLL